MSLTDLFRPGSGLSRRLPASPDDLHGPEQGVVVLPRHLSPPGLREFDVTDDWHRRSLYGIVLTQGTPWRHVADHVVDLTRTLEESTP